MYSMASMLKQFNTTVDEIVKSGITLEQIVKTERRSDGRKYLLIHWRNTDTSADTWITEHEYSMLKYAAT